MQSKGGAAYFILFIPFLLASLFEGDPVTSYLIAWLGSFFIFLASMTGWIKPIPTDLPIGAQLMRPIFLTQIIFAGYLAVTSIFFLLDALGYYYFEKKPYALLDLKQLFLLAKCQRYYCLAHAAFTTGVLYSMNYQRPQWRVSSQKSYTDLFLRLTIYISCIAIVLGFLPGLDQFEVKLKQLGFISSVLSLTFALQQKDNKNALVGSFLFGINLLIAFRSGFKEQILVPFIILAIYLYPLYKTTITIALPIVLVLFFTFIPTYNATFRNANWSGEVDAEEASELAIQQISSGESDLKSTNWDFLTNRLSEIGMFVEYVEKVPSDIDFYGFTIFQQAIESLIPRTFWSDKPNTEQLVMQRVYQIGVIDVNSTTVSAKPPPVTDAYLSGGALGILITALLLGYLASRISVLAENLFGGYLFGSAFIYTGIFQVFWRGNCFEFMLNSIFWSLVLMYILFYIGKKTGFVVQNNLAQS